MYAVESAKDLGDDEWLYQVGDLDVGAWEATFDKIAHADTIADVTLALSQYCRSHPQDDPPVRLQRALSRWKPGRGLALCEGPDPEASVYKPHTRGSPTSLSSVSSSPPRRRTAASSSTTAP